MYLLDLYILAGLSPSLAGLAIAIAVIWDAVSDPIMGIVSDNTPSRNVAGKRIPYLVVGALLLGFSIGFLFSPPEFADQTGLFVNLLTWYLVTNTALTLFGVPYLAIVNDIAPEASDRTALFSSKLVFGSIGLLIGIGIPAYFASSVSVESISDTLGARRSSGFTIGIIAAAGGFATAVLIGRTLRIQKKGPSRSSRNSSRTIGAILKGIKSPHFLLLALGFIAIAIGRSFNSSLALPYYKSALSFSESQIGLILLALTIAIICAAPLWVALVRHAQKALLFSSAAILLAALSAIAYPLFAKEVLWPVIIVAILGGILVASIVLLDGLFSDFIESENTLNDTDLSGSYYGIWRMLSKVARAMGIATSGFLLSKIGYQEASIDQSVSVERAVAWAFGPGVAVFFLIGAIPIVCVLKYKRLSNEV